MRYALVALGIAISIGIAQGWFARAYDRATLAALSEEARLAIEVGCQGHEGRAARSCRSLLKKLYLSGALDPDRTLRSYCESYKHARWGGSRPPPPQLCVQRYGGWRRG